MTKEQVNTIIINGLKSKGIFIGSISPEVLNAFANITYKAINYTHCCESDSDQLCECEIKTLPNGNINYKMCKKCQIEEGLA
jgi:hypothetical protein